MVSQITFDLFFICGRAVEYDRRNLDILSNETLSSSLSLIPQRIHRIAEGCFKGIAAGSEECDKGNFIPGFSKGF